MPLWIMLTQSLIKTETTLRTVNSVPLWCKFWVFLLLLSFLIPAKAKYRDEKCKELKIQVSDELWKMSRRIYGT